MSKLAILFTVMIIGAAFAMPLTELSDATVQIEQLDEETYQNLFVNWMKQHQKSYGHDEFYQRYQTFKTNLDWVRTKNAQGHDGFALNHFADHSQEEFAAKFLGTHINVNNLPPAPATHEPTGMTLPQSVDWRQKGVVTPVKNQGQCGSCWSFSTTGSTEGAHAIATGNLVSLSEQNLMDCSTKYGNQGCNGGLMNQAFEYIIANNGIDTESSYPYEGQDDSCRFQASNVGATISSYRNITTGSEQSLQDAVATAGPVSVAIDANHNEFMFYQSGVLVVPGCSSTQLDHGVLVVGYGTSAGKDYWIVKNSWGASWGMEGYVWMARNHNNMCGIATSASYPIV